jgi:gamma-glutamyltranspeptidase/glutathione hydrolase
MHIVHALNLLEPHDLARLGLPTQSAEAFDVLASALRVAVADHSRHNGDPNWTAVPAAGVASKDFARTRAELVGTRRVPDRVAAGDAAAHDHARPPASCAPLEPYGPAPEIRTEQSDDGAGSDAGDAAGFAALSWTGGAPAAAGSVAAPGMLATAPGARAAAVVAASEIPEGETTHLSVVDRDGNAVALSNTLSPYFGSGAWVEGFFLNSSAVDFSRTDPTAPARSDWRVRSSTISPTIVLEDGRVRAVIGAPGGGRIPGSVIQGLVYMLDYGMDPLEAVRMPRIFPAAGNRRVEIEHGYPGAVLARARALGWEPGLPGDGYARLYVVARVGGAWVGAADPRHDGGARGY